MQIHILKEYVQGDSVVTEYTKDNETVSHIVITPIQNDVYEPIAQTTLEEQILAENQYQTALLEMQMLGGI